GLIGELEILRVLSTYNKNALNSWIGPFSQRYDFRQNLHALEVKASGHPGTTKVSIHGIEQLEPPNNGTLHLIHIRFERLSGSGLSVGGLFDAILRLGADITIFKEHLMALGCSDPHAEVWNRNKYIS
ncbi:PD-(D/E)XK motif protein, partial [Rahnella aceris]|uniref:PD-(D/E)XK motif protein n=1 Tax=Rahnella sp. (strain Y9602) TaxID=2703885 RepID=UPI001C2542C4